MMTTKTQSNTRKVSNDLTALLKNGVPLHLSRGISEQDLDVLYVVAYNLYSEKKYQEALRVFESIAFYNHFDKRGWLGSAACFQMLGDYSKAIVAYSYVSLIDSEDPLPVFHAVECYIALRRYLEAHSALGVLLTLTDKKPKFVKIQNWAVEMQELLPKS